MPHDGAAASAGSDGRRWDVWPRFIAALIVSGLLHAGLTNVLAPRSGARFKAMRAPAAPLGLSARLLMADEALPVARRQEPDAADTPAPAAPAKRDPSRTAPAARAVSAKDEDDHTAAFSEVADTTYYGARQLDRYPELVAALELSFPAGVASENAGHVLLLVLIDAQGRVNDASVVEAEPPGVFDDEARRSLLNAQFKPALKGGRAVRSRLVVHVSYGKPQ